MNRVVRTPPPLRCDSGGVLLSHTLSSAVPSALVGLASGFGMGPGVSPPLLPPLKIWEPCPAMAGVVVQNCIVDARSLHSCFGK